VIDNPKQVADLLSKLAATLPLPAIVTPRLTAILHQQSPGAPIPKECQVIWVSNAGDEGGIVCKLSVEGNLDNKLEFFTSITHLDFDRRSPLARENGVYQKHRVKKLRQQAG
jgi:hypothetical protein